jgi:hypothetical protein
MSNERKRTIALNFIILAIGAILLLMAVNTQGQSDRYFDWENLDLTNAEALYGNDFKSEKQGSMETILWAKKAGDCNMLIEYLCNPTTKKVLNKATTVSILFVANSLTEVYNEYVKVRNDLTSAGFHTSNSLTQPKQRWSQNPKTTTEVIIFIPQKVPGKDNLYFSKFQWINM